MEGHRFDQVARQLGRFQDATPRRALLGGAAAFGAALASSAMWADDADAKKKNKKKNKKKKKKGCLKNGTLCTKKGKKCDPKHCLKANFTIEAEWTADSDHDTFLFVPNEAGASLPAPYIDYGCNPIDSDCENDLYPFICVSQDATGPGDEETTVRQLLPGTYEYWIELESPSVAGELTITLRQPNGTVVRSWTNPANETLLQRGWHVFDINGSKGSITSIDVLIEDGLPGGAHTPSTDVCP